MSDKTLTVTHFRQGARRRDLADLMMAIGRHQDSKRHAVVAAISTPETGLYWICCYLPGQSFELHWFGREADSVRPRLIRLMAHLHDQGYRPVEKHMSDTLIQSTRPAVHRHLLKHPDYLRESLRHSFGSS